MARRQTAAAAKQAPERPARPKNRDLPGMEDRAIRALEEVAEKYADIRDQRMQLTEDEHALKQHAMALMRKHGKTIYKHNGVEILIVPGEDDIKVKVKKAEDAKHDDGDDDDEPADPPADQGEFAAERRAAVEGD